MCTMICEARRSSIHVCHAQCVTKYMCIDQVLTASMECYACREARR